MFGNGVNVIATAVGGVIFIFWGVIPFVQGVVVGAPRDGNFYALQNWAQLGGGMVRELGGTMAGWTNNPANLDGRPETQNGIRVMDPALAPYSTEIPVTVPTVPTVPAQPQQPLVNIPGFTTPSAPSNAPIFVPQTTAQGIAGGTAQVNSQGQTCDPSMPQDLDCSGGVSTLEATRYANGERRKN